MILSERLPAPVERAWLLTQRFQKFVVVGAVGLAVNQIVLVILHGGLGMALKAASPISIFMSMIVTFGLNEYWTWHDRAGGPLVHRVGMYFPINMVGLLINYIALQVLVDHTGLHYVMANFIGAALAAIWNFFVNNSITWRQRPASTQEPVV